MVIFVIFLFSFKKSIKIMEENTQQRDGNIRGSKNKKYDAKFKLGAEKQLRSTWT